MWTYSFYLSILINFNSLQKDSGIDISPASNFNTTSKLFAATTPKNNTNSLPNENEILDDNEKLEFSDSSFDLPDLDINSVIFIKWNLNLLNLIF